MAVRISLDDHEVGCFYHTGCGSAGTIIYRDKEEYYCYFGVSMTPEEVFILILASARVTLSDGGNQINLRFK